MQVKHGWNFLRKKGYFAVKVDARNKGCMKAISAVIAEACKEKTERDRKRGIKNRPVRAMVVGIECRKIHIYQYLCRKSLRKVWCDAG